MEFRRSGAGSKNSSFIKKNNKISIDDDTRMQQSLMSEFSSHMKFASDERLKEIKELKVVRKF